MSGRAKNGPKAAWPLTPHLDEGMLRASVSHGRELVRKAKFSESLQTRSLIRHWRGGGGVSLISVLSNLPRDADAQGRLNTIALREWGPNSIR